MKTSIRLAVFAFLLGALSLPSHSVSIVNGGFETALAGWTTADQLGSEGSFIQQTGTTSPVNADPVPAPPGGTFAAMTDAMGPGAHVLYQTFTALTPVSSAQLSFDLFVGNRAPDFYAPDTLDFATPELNQQARVDLLLASADPFSVAPGDILINLFQTSSGDPLISGYNHYSFEIASILNAHLNTPLMLRFAETDNVFIFQFGVDNVSIDSVPETMPPGALFALLLGLCWVRRWTFPKRK